MSRVFDAPPELVFRAYTDPDQIPQWWGPRRYTTTVDQMDVANEYAFNGVYREIVPAERLVSTFEFEGMPGHVVLDIATFEEEDGKTKLTTVSLFQTGQDRDGMLESGMEEGAAETLDRLAELLARQTQV